MEDVLTDRPALPAVLIVMPVLCSILLAAAHLEWPLDDFAEYWAAGRLNAAGHNPYDAGSMLEEQRHIGWHEPRPVMMYNPPWTLALAMPASMVDFQLARWMWLSAQILITLWCASRLWLLYGGAPRQAMRASCLALLWSPTLFAFRMGQVSPLLLLGLVGFLWALPARRDATAGALFSLTAVKPQLVLLVWIPFLAWTVHERRWRVLAGSAACITTATIVALSTNPGAFVEFARLLRAAPPSLEFESPNLATVLQRVAGTGALWPQFVPTCLGAVAVGAMWCRRRQAWTWPREMPALVLLSCLLTSYGGWGFDLVVLLIPVVATVAVATRRPERSETTRAASAFAAISTAAFIMHTARVPQFAFLWMTPAVAIVSYRLRDRSGGSECAA